MFKNPFDSFHNTVAEAKEEREQLEALLTISTPRERLLVAAIAALLVVLGAWLVFGNVHRSVALEGILDAVDDRSVQALVWVRAEVGPAIETGMPALLELAAQDGPADTLDGEVAAVAAAGLSEVPAFAASAPVSVYRIDIALDRPVDPESLATRECRVVIELGQQSPLALFGMGPS